jgi:epsilon-lactone hydrolase
MAARVHFHGPLGHSLRSAAALGQSIAEASLARVFKRPQGPGRNWFVQVATRVLKRQLAIAFKMRDVKEARLYLDSLVIAPAAPAVEIRDVVHPQFRGSWFVPGDAHAQRTVLYLHGGGYSFYPRGYAHFIKRVALAASSRTFALDYQLAPEHRFPSQLEEALNGYRWLLENGASPNTLVVVGDSAGANLALALLLAARDSRIPLPALAVAMSPPTGFAGVPRSGEIQHGDWIDERMLKQWVSWFCDSTQLRNPLVSPVYADLRGLPPIYIQAGGAEILYDSVQAFVHHAQKQGADVAFESWENMTHVFQIFAPYVPQSVEALRRIGEVIHARTRGTRTSAASS